MRTLGWTTQSYKQQNKAENVLRNPSGIFSPEDKGNEVPVTAYGWIDVVSAISSRFLVSLPIYLSMICVLRKTDSVCRRILNTSVSKVNITSTGMRRRIYCLSSFSLVLRKPKKLSVMQTKQVDDNRIPEGIIIYVS